jgi:hypothetical protein
MESIYLGEFGSSKSREPTHASVLAVRSKHLGECYPERTVNEFLVRYLAVAEGP